MKSKREIKKCKNCVNYNITFNLCFLNFETVYKKPGDICTQWKKHTFQSLSDDHGMQYYDRKLK